MKDNNFVVYQKQDILKLLDYITNLQQENESNINRIHELEQEIDSEYIQKEDYKSRCEKAIEYIKKFQKYFLDRQPFVDTRHIDLEYLLNILQNGDDK
jgi:hypothetical protein